MGQQTSTPAIEHGFELGNIQHVTDIIINSRSILDAVEMLEAHIASNGLSLLFLGAYDPETNRDCTVVYSTFPDSLRQMCTKFDGVQGCPLVQLAVKGGKPFEALSLYLPGFDGFFSMQYLEELQALNFEKIDVVPVEVSGSVFVSFIGYEKTSAHIALSRRIGALFAQLMVGLSVKYNLAGISREALRHGRRKAKNTSFNATEKKCLSWIASGKSLSDIADQLKLSEHAVNQYIKTACDKMQARSRSHAIAIAMQLGIIDCRGV